MIEALFVGMAALALVSSLLVILHRNPVTSALFLVVAFCSLAASTCCCTPSSSAWCR